MAVSLKPKLTLMMVQYSFQSLTSFTHFQVNKLAVGTSHSHILSLFQLWHKRAPTGKSQSSEDFEVNEEQTLPIESLWVERKCDANVCWVNLNLRFIKHFSWLKLSFRGAHCEITLLIWIVLCALTSVSERIIVHTVASSTDSVFSLAEMFRLLLIKAVTLSSVQN